VFVRWCIWCIHTSVGAIKTRGRAMPTHSSDWGKWIHCSESALNQNSNVGSSNPMSLDPYLLGSAPRRPQRWAHEHHGSSSPAVRRPASTLWCIVCEVWFRW
jgi:hypothetical protein